MIGLRSDHYRRSRAAAALLLLAAALTGCGRKLPQLDEAALATKSSLLVAAAPSMSEAEEEQLRDGAYAFAKEQKWALDWIGRTAFTPELTEKLRSTPYNGIILAGDELMPQALEAARSLPDKRFVLLGNSLEPPQASDVPANAAVRGVEAARKEAVWDAWVQTQKAAGQSILFITSSAKPIPSAWAPSEEADRVLVKDQYPGDTWLPQLTYQTQAQPTAWIALRTALEPAESAKLKPLRIPVVDMTGGLQLTLNWTRIMQSATSAIQDPSTPGGFRAYTAEEAGLERKN